jgi:nucleotide-binding universal stress UspA family protein
MKVTKAQYESLPDDLKKIFKKVDDTEDYDNGEENAAELKKARDRERDEAKKLREERDSWHKEKEELEEKVADFESGSAKTGQDKEALKKSYDAKIAKLQEKHTGEVERIKGSLRKTHVDSVAERIANEISTAPDLLVPLLKGRLAVDLDADEPSTQVLDLLGKPSAATIEELKQEFLSNQKFAAILIGSKGSGGGAGGGGNGGGAFDVKAYSNEDGTTNWTKVHQGMKDDPQLLSKVQEARKPSAS